MADRPTRDNGGKWSLAASAWPPGARWASSGRRRGRQATRAFNRRKDWADIEEMLRAGRIDGPYVTGILNEYLGPDDGRIRELLVIRDETAGLSGS